MSKSTAVSPFTVAGVVIHQDAEGRFCLNDLHRAAGGLEKDKPIKYLRSEKAASLVAELEKGQICPVSTVAGRNGGTYVLRELVYAYANWISAPFYLKVIRTFDAVATGNLDALPPAMMANLDALIVRSLTSPEVFQRLGGMYKAIFIKQADEAINARLPAMVEAAAARSMVNIMPGISAGEVWYDMLHLPKLHNGPQYLSSVLRRLNCQIDGGGRAKAGRSSVILFDPDKVRNQIKFGGLLKFMREYVAQKMGQHSLFPINADMLKKPGCAA